MDKDYKLKKVISIVRMANVCVVIFLLVFLLFGMQIAFTQETEEWIARYNGPANYFDYANAITTDPFGNIYVTGASYGIGTSSDYATISYDSSGNVRWVRRYNGPANSYDYATAIATDSYGNIYVTGGSVGIGTNADYATVSYDIFGNERWVARYNGPLGYEHDKANAIVIDSYGNIYVTGGSYGQGYATVSYDSSGNERWVARYEGGIESTAIAVDSSGNVYVTGDSGVDYATVSYDSSGNQRWAKRYNGPGNRNDRAYAIAVDSSGNVYVTGISIGILLYADYATVSYDSSGNERWVATYNGPGNRNDVGGAITTDLSGNIYVTGSSYGSGTVYDYATISYDSYGKERWIARYDGGGGDIAGAITIDPFGIIYVTGNSWSWDGRGFIDYATVAYDSTGNQQWVARYKDLVNNVNLPKAITTDLSGNIYVTGWSYDGTLQPPSLYRYDYLTIKYSPISKLPLDCSITSPNEGDIFCVGQDITFLTSYPGGDESLIQWSGGEEPATGSGASFTTKFLTPGEKTVTVSCDGSSDTRTVTILSEPSDCLPLECSITSPNEGDIFCIGQDITFTAVTNPGGDESLISWSGGGEPTTGTGANFITSFSTHGEKTVTASCGGSSVTRTVTILPETSNCEFIDFSRKIPLKPVENILRKIPGVDEVETSVSAGAEMCDCCYLGTIIERGEISGDFGVNLNATWDIPTRLGIPWHTKKPIQIGSYKVTGSGKIGIIITADGNADGSGTIKQDCNTELCIEGPFEISGTITAEATFKAELCAEGPMVPKWCWELELTLGTFSTGVTGKYELNTCGENKWGLCWNGIEHERKFKIEIKDWSTEAGIKVTLVEEKCWPKSE